MRPLSQRNQDIVHIYYQDSSMSMAAIGRKYRISRQRVGRILKRYKSIRICANCYHYQSLKQCSCRISTDVITTPNKCTDWCPVNGGHRG